MQKSGMANFKIKKLEQAAIALSSPTVTGEPFFWAPFIIVGDGG